MRFLRLIFPIFILATGCKQELGDRCQVDSDCAEGRCSSDGICRLDNSGGTVFDAGPRDAAIDAALDDVDAPIETPDAPPADEPDAAEDEADAGEADAGEADAA